jgi:NADH-quinone oxidoreductase subunit F
MVMDEDTNMVDATRFFLTFLTNESCGKCVPCREGIRQLLTILGGMCEGKGKAGDIETMQEIAEVMSAASLCALGKTGTDPLKGGLRYFREEYEATIKNQRPPAGQGV